MEGGEFKNNAADIFLLWPKSNDSKKSLVLFYLFTLWTDPKNVFKGMPPLLRRSGSAVCTALKTERTTIYLEDFFLTYCFADFNNNPLPD
jgi:hypothetical protein